MSVALRLSGAAADEAADGYVRDDAMEASQHSIKKLAGHPAVSEAWSSTQREYELNCGCSWKAFPLHCFDKVSSPEHHSTSYFRVLQAIETRIIGIPHASYVVSKTCEYLAAGVVASVWYSLGVAPSSGRPGGRCHHIPQSLDEIQFHSEPLASLRTVLRAGVKCGLASEDAPYQIILKHKRGRSSLLNLGAQVPFRISGSVAKALVRGEALKEIVTEAAGTR
ncbi:uncharacterized protein LY79DRAFT_660252 [Colletotrichum navitas]|uniref:Uncharacterized protein n=1 Tax=Colletotrichum navitas TaxID=681940 RepID=A0AAD8V4H4_9PEZI|nr:uncharacterized protein LY79DRAFT_660252 [Colletotrichum navitas]KAK1585925.1 hypothetical protein LY79DRAFT_660252 [Colletotrichum navitas]